MTLTAGVVVLGVADRDRAAAFWTEALGYDSRTDGFGGWELVLVPLGAATGMQIAFQRSLTPPDSHPRVHLDLHAVSRAEQESESARLVALGATMVDWDSYPEDPDFVVLADTEGNRFCVVDLSHPR